MGNGWVDVSQPLVSGLAVWPGDPPVVVERFQHLDRGDPCSVSRLSTSLHAGTHVDAPCHYLAGGAGIEALPLALCVGAAVILEVASGGGVVPSELVGRLPRRVRRVLFKSAGGTGGTWLTLAAARFLAEGKVALVGVDGPSVGAADAEGEEVHRLLLGAGVWILEGLELAKVPAGPCHLVCAPLLVVGADGAPARVFLRPRRPRKMG